MNTRIRLIQQKLGITADGVMGPNTLGAICKALGISEPVQWPLQSEVRRGNSMFGKPGDESNLVSIVPPYTLYYEGKALRSIRVHRAIASHVQDALREVLEHYGAEKIHALGFDRYSGSYNYRSTAAGRSLSMHAWGIALDFAAESNAYATKAPRASLSAPACAKWWEIWESHGAVSLGRARDYDWMHLQFARLG